MINQKIRENQENHDTNRKKLEKLVEDRKILKFS